MGEIRIKIEDESLLTRVGDLARQHNRSVSQEIVALVRDALSTRPRREELMKIADAIAAKTPKDIVQTDSVTLVREDRSR